MGRPSLYIEDLAAEICERIAEGESLNAICSDQRMPSEATVRHWALEDREGFFAKYARARDVQMDREIDRLIELADGALGMPTEGVAAMKLAIDTRKWVASKLAPKKYGDKLEHRHSGADGGPITVVHEIVRPGEKG